MKRRARPRPAIAAGVPAELGNPDDPVWHNQAAYRAYMAERGWRLPASERFRVPASPPYRRRCAIGGWARTNGMTSGANPDWHELSTLGLP